MATKKKVAAKDKDAPSLDALMKDTRLWCSVQAGQIKTMENRMNSFGDQLEKFSRRYEDHVHKFHREPPKWWQRWFLR